MPRWEQQEDGTRGDRDVGDQNDADLDDEHEQSLPPGRIPDILEPR
jgi:hypothetical protein